MDFLSRHEERSWCRDVKGWTMAKRYAAAIAVAGDPSHGCDADPSTERSLSQETNTTLAPCMNIAKLLQDFSGSNAQIDRRIEQQAMPTSLADHGSTHAPATATGAGSTDSQDAWPAQRGVVEQIGRFIRTHLQHALISLALVGLATLVYFGIDALGLLDFGPVVYLVPVVIAATRWGTFPAIIASIAGFLVSDYFFYPPYYSFAVENPQEVVHLLLFLFVALVTSNLASKLKREADALRASRKELSDLYEFSRRLAACFTTSDLVLAIQAYLTNTLQRSVYLIGATGDDEIEPADGHPAPESVKKAAATMIAANEHDIRTIVDPFTRCVWLMRPLVSETAHHGVMAVDLGAGSRDAVASMARRVDTVLADAATTLERLDLAKAMNDANFRQQADMLKEALIGTVSHELRTPLTSILGSASVLDQTPAVQENAAVRALVEAVRDEAKYLDNNIQNLLNATRITARGVQPRLEWVDPGDVVNAAIKQRSQRLAKHRLEVDLGADLPLVKIESTLIEQALGQLLENAAKYSPAGSAIRISAHADKDRVELSVSDEGDGLTPEETHQLGRRAFRGKRHLGTVPGSGLGLWIAKTFVSANGGTLGSVSRGPGLGTTMSIRLPATLEPTPELMATTDG
jgi:K+-sensing histidine kinase KdpD